MTVTVRSVLWLFGSTGQRVECPWPCRFYAKGCAAASIDRRAQAVAPAGEQAIGVVRERNERARELAMRFGPIERIGAIFPAFVGLQQRTRARRRSVDVSIGTAAGGVDEVGMPQVLEEARQTQRVSEQSSGQLGPASSPSTPRRPPPCCPSVVTQKPIRRLNLRPAATSPANPGGRMLAQVIEQLDHPPVATRIPRSIVSNSSAAQRITSSNSAQKDAALTCTSRVLWNRVLLT